MKNSTKFNKEEHIAEISPVEGFPGLYYVSVADEYEDPNTKEPYSYGVDENGENDGSCRIVLVNVAMSKSQLRRHMDRLVSFMVAEGFHRGGSGAGSYSGREPRPEHLSAPELRVHHPRRESCCQGYQEGARGWSLPGGHPGRSCSAYGRIDKGDELSASGMAELSRKPVLTFFTRPSAAGSWV